MAAIARCAASTRACGDSAPLRRRDRTNAPALGPAVNPYPLPVSSSSSAQRQASAAAAPLVSGRRRLQAMLGSPSARTWRTCGSLRRGLQERSTRFAFVSADRSGNAIDIEAMGVSDRFSELVKILDDGIATLHDGFLAGSSSGVQIIGGRRPSARHAVSIVLRIVAFARCLQFQVSKYVTA